MNQNNDILIRADIVEVNGICLQNVNNLSSEDVEYVCDVFKKYISIT